MRARIVVLSVLTFALALPSLSAQASPKTVTQVRGSWIETGGACVPQGIEGTVLHLTCTGTAAAVGTWTGVWVEDVDLYLDLETDDVWGSAHETFTGRAADGTSGSLDVVERLRIDGTDSTLYGEGDIVGGTGDWVGSSGTYTAQGFNPAVGFGSYEARWVRPSTKRAHR
jgi:hypothetical protein